MIKSIKIAVGIVILGHHVEELICLQFILSETLSPNTNLPSGEIMFILWIVQFWDILYEDCLILWIVQFWDTLYEDCRKSHLVVSNIIFISRKNYIWLAFARISESNFGTCCILEL